MRQWTEAERQRQAELIRGWKPWRMAGVKTPEGKEITRLNAWKHGAYSADFKRLRKVLAGN